MRDGCLSHMVCCDQRPAAGCALQAGRPPGCRASQIQRKLCLHRHHPARIRTWAKACRAAVEAVIACALQLLARRTFKHASWPYCTAPSPPFLCAAKVTSRHVAPHKMNDGTVQTVGCLPELAVGPHQARTAAAAGRCSRQPSPLRCASAAARPHVPALPRRPSRPPGLARTLPAAPRLPLQGARPRAPPRCAPHRAEGAAAERVLCKLSLARRAPGRGARTAHRGGAPRRWSARRPPGSPGAGPPRRPYRPTSRRPPHQQETA